MKCGKLQSEEKSIILDVWNVSFVEGVDRLFQNQVLQWTFSSFLYFRRTCLCLYIACIYIYVYIYIHTYIYTVLICICIQFHNYD